MWSVPKIWDDGECWIIGGGPSLPYEFGVPEKIINQVIKQGGSPSLYSPYITIHDKHVIGVNAAYLIGNWIDMLIFGDNGFYLAHRKRLAEFPGLKISCHPIHDKYRNEGIKVLKRDKKKFGLSDNDNSVVWGGNTGCTAISLAVHTGVKRIILLGFDMDILNNSQHWHSIYKSSKRPMDAKRLMSLPFGLHKKCFPDIAKDAKSKGIEILNASSNSTIEVFKKVKVKDLL